jgi:hypothetical protein
MEKEGKKRRRGEGNSKQVTMKQTKEQNSATNVWKLAM